MPDADVSPTSGRPRSAGCTAVRWCRAGSTLVLVGDLSRRPGRSTRSRRRWTAGRRDRAGRALSPPPTMVGGPLLAFDRAGAVQSQVRLTAAGGPADRPGVPGPATGEPGLRRLLLLPAGGEHPRGQGLHLLARVRRWSSGPAGPRSPWPSTPTPRHRGRRCWRPGTSSAGSRSCRRPRPRSSRRATTRSAPGHLVGHPGRVCVDAVHAWPVPGWTRWLRDHPGGWPR